MKKHILVAVSAAMATSAVMGKGTDVATVSIATPHPVCDGTPNGAGAANDGKASVWGGSGAVPTNTDVVFTRAGFDVQCSNNVFLQFQENGPTLAGVGSGSAKGNQTFAGTTNGGAVSPAGTCAATGCVESNATQAMTNALATATQT